ncbi:hypothetical protein [Campylobacter phage CJLB-12]|nr:hypothetical protein [Campylobacter phage CJLB-12]
MNPFSVSISKILYLIVLWTSRILTLPIGVSTYLSLHS